MTHQTACSKSWTDININFKKRKLGHCCASTYHDMPKVLTHDYFDNNIRIQQRRQDTLDGIQHSDCNACWQDINQGIPTLKDLGGEWDNFSNVKPDVPQVNYIEMELDNICDLSCLYCWPEHSSKIAQEEGEYVENKTTQQDIDIYKEWLKATVENSKHPIDIAFLGGEPTASKLFYEMIEFIAKLDCDNITIQVTTNGNTKPHLFKKFTDVLDKSTCSWIIHVSNESKKDDSRLIRYGLEWDRFESNLRSYAQHPKVQKLLFDVAMNAVALPTFPEYMTWVHDVMSEYDKPFTVGGSNVNNPQELNVSILHKSFKKYIEQAEQIIEQRPLPNRIRKDKILKFFNRIKKRIGSNYKENYETIIREFLEQKQVYKKTNELVHLAEKVKNVS